MTVTFMRLIIGVILVMNSVSFRSVLFNVLFVTGWNIIIYLQFMLCVSACFKQTNPYININTFTEPSI
jgi:hypothetical protein